MKKSHSGNIIILVLVLSVEIITLGGTWRELLIILNIIIVLSITNIMIKQKR